MPLNIDWQQILLHMFNFVLLFALLYFILYKPIRDFMEKRQQHYRELDEQAQQTVAQANEKKAEYDRLTADADQRVAAFEAERRAQAEAAAAQELAAAQEKAKQVVDAARAGAKAEREQMLRQAREEIAKMAGDMARQIASDDTGAAFDAFLNQAERSEEHDA